MADRIYIMSASSDVLVSNILQVSTNLFDMLSELDAEL